MTCPNKDWIKKYGVKCKIIDKKIKCKNLKKIKEVCKKCFYFHLIKCHGNIYALPCMYPCGENTGLYSMCPNIEKSESNKCYKIIGTFEFK